MNYLSLSRPGVGSSQILLLPLTRCDSLYNILDLSRLSFLLSKMRVINQTEGHPNICCPEKECKGRLLVPPCQPCWNPSSLFQTPRNFTKNPVGKSKLYSPSLLLTPAPIGHLQAAPWTQSALGSEEAQGDPQRGLRLFRQRNLRFLGPGHHLLRERVQVLMVTISRPVDSGGLPLPLLLDQDTVKIHGYHMDYTK